jgi:hypothetical protein
MEMTNFEMAKVFGRGSRAVILQRAADTGGMD